MTLHSGMEDVAHIPWRQCSHQTEYITRNEETEVAHDIINRELTESTSIPQGILHSCIMKWVSQLHTN